MADPDERAPPVGDSVGASSANDGGLLGIARDLIARVVERRLDQPDSLAGVHRSRSSASFEPTTPPIPTVTLAEIYEEQGLPERAVAVLDEMLAADPTHPGARALRARIVQGGRPAVDRASARWPAARLEAQRTDAAIELRWSLTEAAQAELGSDPSAANLVVRVFVVIAAWDGPQPRSIEQVAPLASGSVTIADVPPQAFVRAVLGVGSGSGFVALALASLDPTAPIAVVRNVPGLATEQEEWPHVFRAPSPSSPARSP